jgi:hypothetical protein
MLHNFNFLIRWISSRGIEGSNLSTRWPRRLREMPGVCFTLGMGGVGVFAGVIGFEVIGTNGAAVILAQVKAGVLELDVPFDSTRLRFGRFVCNGPFG